MKCSHCQRLNPDEHRYCGYCGSTLPREGSVALKDLIEDGILPSGAALSCSHRGQTCQATLKGDGAIEWEGNLYATPMLAIEAVRGAACDSWFCWNCPDPATGRGYSLAHFRGMLLRKRGQRP